ncbi:MAG: hypothetical protein ACLFPA_08150 [Dichotomicrobium sp.]
MSEIGKPISRLEDIARYLYPERENPNHPTRHRPATADHAQAAPLEEPCPVYAGMPVAVEDDELIFDTAPRITTQMDFVPDALGYLVNGEGLVLMGRSDSDHGHGLRLQPIRLDDGAVMAARATTTIRYKANLPKTPVAGSCHVDAAAGEAETGTRACDALAGGEVCIFDTRGRPVTIRLRWLKIGEGDAEGHDRWRLLYRVMGDALSLRAAGRRWQTVEQDFTFDARGRLSEGTAVTLDLGPGMEPVTLDFGRCGLTQFADSTGLVKVLACTQNGWPSAGLREVAVREDGRVLGRFDNDRVGLLGMAAFADALDGDGMKRAA